ncbi:hypothetical protein ACP2AV_09345 [Aliiroseovarius sp. PTFE2010]|uniref:hypothetical protein n=1 Tax=Aliiroseovarius sp. PTFE2010 TaxID=3417190 RepID=UPI003CEE3C56
MSLALAIPAQAASYAPTVQAGSLEDKMVRFLERNDCRASEGAVFFELMSQGATLPGAQEILQIWTDEGWLRPTTNDNYTLSGVGKCR